MIHGEPGYIDGQKKNYIIKATIFAVLVVIVFGLSEILKIKEVMYLKVLSALMMLPTALFIAKFSTLMHYASNSDERYKYLLNIFNKDSILAELVLVRNKYTVYYNFIVIGDTEMIVYKEKFTSSESEKVTKELLQLILKGKGIDTTILVYNDFDKMCLDLAAKKQTVIKEGSKERDIREVLLNNAI